MAIVPLPVIPLVLYGFAALVLHGGTGPVAGAGQLAAHPFWDRALVNVTLVSGQSWALTNGTLMVAVGLAALLVSTLRAAAAGRTSVPRTMTAVVVLCVYIVLFLTTGFAGTSVFFLLTVIALTDTLMIVSVSMVASKPRPGPAAD